MKKKDIKKNIKKLYKMSLLDDLRMSLSKFNFVMINTIYKILVLIKTTYIIFKIISSNSFLITILDFRCFFLNIFFHNI